MIGIFSLTVFSKTDMLSLNVNRHCRGKVVPPLEQAGKSQGQPEEDGLTAICILA